MFTLPGTRDMTQYLVYSSKTFEFKLSSELSCDLGKLELFFWCLISRGLWERVFWHKGQRSASPGGGGSGSGSSLASGMAAVGPGAQAPASLYGIPSSWLQPALAGAVCGHWAWNQQKTEWYSLPASSRVPAAGQVCLSPAHQVCF